MQDVQRLPNGVSVIIADAKASRATLNRFEQDVFVDLPVITLRGNIRAQSLILYGKHNIDKFASCLSEGMGSSPGDDEETFVSSTLFGRTYHLVVSADIAVEGEPPVGIMLPSRVSTTVGLIARQGMVNALHVIHNADKLAIIAYPQADQGGFMVPCTAFCRLAKLLEAHRGIFYPSPQQAQRA